MSFSADLPGSRPDSSCDLIIPIRSARRSTALYGPPRGLPEAMANALSALGPIPSAMETVEASKPRRKPRVALFLMWVAGPLAGFEIAIGIILSNVLSLALGFALGLVTASVFVLSRRKTRQRVYPRGE